MTKQNENSYHVVKVLQKLIGVFMDAAISMW